MEHRSIGARQSRPDHILQVSARDSTGRRCPAGTVVVATSVNRLVAARPHSAGHVEAPGPDIIMRRCATSERTMTPAKTSTGLVQVIPRLAGKHDHRARVVSATLTSCDGASATPCRWRVQKCKLDNKSQLKGRMTAQRSKARSDIGPQAMSNSACMSARHFCSSASFAWSFAG
jgi:hypothetical protein